jgi:hypothetical protein
MRFRFTDSIKKYPDTTRPEIAANNSAAGTTVVHVVNIINVVARRASTGELDCTIAKEQDTNERETTAKVMCILPCGKDLVI